MAVLQRAGLVESTRIGQWTYYRRNDARIARLAELLGQSL
jgi:ArsR family transcriptional regulator